MIIDWRTYIMANIHFLRKIAKDELFDTMFFATGEQVTVVKTKDNYTLTVPGIQCVIVHNRNIKINNVKTNSITQAKLELQRYAQ